MRRTVLVAAILALAATGSAEAKIPSGQWVGHYGKDSTAKVTFTVKDQAIHGFASFVPALCWTFGPLGPMQNFVFQTFSVPTAPIANGKVSTTFDIKQKGETIGKRRLTATFNGSNATGTLSGTSGPCTIAKYHWQAHH